MREDSADQTLLVLDSGAISALSDGVESARATVDFAVGEGRTIVIPAVVLAESTTGRGPRDARVNRVVAAADAIAPIDENVARRAGALRYDTGCRETVDALIVAMAVESGLGVLILTGEQNGGHVSRLASGHPRVRVEAV